MLLSPSSSDLSLLDFWRGLSLPLLFTVLLRHFRLSFIHSFLSLFLSRTSAQAMRTPFSLSLSFPLASLLSPTSTHNPSPHESSAILLRFFFLCLYVFSFLSFTVMRNMSSFGTAATPARRCIPGASLALYSLASLCHRYCCTPLHRMPFLVYCLVCSSAVSLYTLA